MSSKSEKTRARILQTTLDLLASGSPQQTRISDIAKASGISRQALYLHYPNRAELLIAATKYLDERVNIDDSLAESRTATDGKARLSAFMRAWGNHIPVIYGIGRALMAMSETDTEARAAWDNRMAAVRHGCAAAVKALIRDGVLRADLTEASATDLLWTLLSVRNWEALTQTCGWSQDRYLSEMTRLAKAALMDTAPGE
ncbi:TetR/AcrR family transcriptional regulator [Yoonia algicola]|uniref:TetR/AcrR family transcriptional regulator n=1 Tax=Yoonia algicola TaxID=3137368 RepID=A0AAN0MFX2_9RHOB